MRAEQHRPWAVTITIAASGALHEGRPWRGLAEQHRGGDIHTGLQHLDGDDDTTLCSHGRSDRLGLHPTPIVRPEPAVQKGHLRRRAGGEQRRVRGACGGDGVVHGDRQRPRLVRARDRIGDLAGATLQIFGVEVDPTDDLGRGEALSEVAGHVERIQADRRGDAGVVHRAEAVVRHGRRHPRARGQQRRAEPAAKSVQLAAGLERRAHQLDLVEHPVAPAG